MLFERNETDEARKWLGELEELLDNPIKMVIRLVDGGVTIVLTEIEAHSMFFLRDLLS